MTTILAATLASAKTPKPLVTIELERRATVWPAADQLALPQDVSAALADFAKERAHLAEVEQAVKSTARQEAGESPTDQLEKAQAFVRGKRIVALAALRPAARTAPQLLVLADLESEQAQDVYDQAVEAETKAPKLDMRAVEATCAKAMAASPDPEVARSLGYLWGMALEARADAAEAVKRYKLAAEGAPEPWRSEMLYRIGNLALARDRAGALAAWAQVTASPWVVYARFRQVQEQVRVGACPSANEILVQLQSAPAIVGTSFVEVGTATAAACKGGKARPAP